MAGIVVDIILFFIVAGNATIGYRRGLARVVFNICSTIVAIILVFVLYQPTTNFVINNTKLSEKMETAFQENLQYIFETNGNETPQELQENKNLMNALNVFIGDEMGNLIQDTTDSVVKYVSIQISHKIISVVVFFALFTIIRLALYVLRNYVELIGDLPIIRVFNGSGRNDLWNYQRILANLRFICYNITYLTNYGKYRSHDCDSKCANW